MDSGSPLRYGRNDGLLIAGLIIHTNSAIVKFAGDIGAICAYTIRNFVSFPYKPTTPLWTT